MKENRREYRPPAAEATTDRKLQGTRYKKVLSHEEIETGVKMTSEANHQHFIKLI